MMYKNRVKWINKKSPEDIHKSDLNIHIFNVNRLEKMNL